MRTIDALGLAIIAAALTIAGAGGVTQIDGTGWQVAGWIGVGLGAASLLAAIATLISSQSEPG